MAMSTDNNQAGESNSIDRAVDLDRVLKVLADADRRSLIRYLSDCCETSVKLGTCIDHLKSHRYDGDTGETTDRLSSVLHHTHLPKLEDTGLIEYDSSTDSVHYRPNPAVDDLLELLEEYDR